MLGGGRSTRPETRSPDAGPLYCSASGSGGSCSLKLKVIPSTALKLSSTERFSVFGQQLPELLQLRLGNLHGSLHHSPLEIFSLTPFHLILKLDLTFTISLQPGVVRPPLYLMSLVRSPVTRSERGKVLVISTSVLAALTCLRAGRSLATPG